MSSAPPPSVENLRSTILKEVADALRAADGGITNIQTVIAASKVPLQDIIDEFGDTNGLVIALVEMLAVSMLEPLEDCMTENSFQQNLLAFSDRVTDERLSSQLKCLYRIGLTEVIRNSGIGRDFYKRGPGLMTAGLARFFKAAQGAGIVLEEDSHSLASHFMALLRANLDFSGTLSPDGANGLSSPRGNVSRVIELFCSGIQSERNDAYAVL